MLENTCSAVGNPTSALGPSGSSFGPSSLSPIGTHHLLLRNSTTEPVGCCAVVGQYGSDIDSSLSHPAATLATVISSLNEVPTTAVIPGSSSGRYGNGAVGGMGVSLTAMHGGMTSSDLWCRGAAGHSDMVGTRDHSSDMAGRKTTDTWLSGYGSEDLAELFSRIGLGKYTDIFQQQEVNMISLFLQLCVL